LTKALTFSPERASYVAECRVSEHTGLIHAFDVGHDPGLQQQSTLLDQLGHFREAQPRIAEGLRGAVLGGLGRSRILRIHLLHGLFQECHVIDHRKTAPAIVGFMAQFVRGRPMAQLTLAQLKRAAGSAVIAPWRTNSAQFHRPWRATIKQQKNDSGILYPGTIAQSAVLAFNSIADVFDPLDTLRSHES
jgi:hypothetical protein